MPALNLEKYARDDDDDDGHDGYRTSAELMIRHTIGCCLLNCKPVLFFF